mgnify:CR=1 FL=1
MNHHSGHFLPSHRRGGGFGRWASLVLGLALALAIVGLLLVGGRSAGSGRLLDDITTPAGAPSPASYAGSRDPSVPAAETVHFTAQDSDTAPVATF